MRHVLKNASYGIVLVGMLTNVYRLYGKLDSTNSSLETEIEERRSVETRFALAVKGTSDGLWDWNIITNEMWWAPRFKGLLGYRDDELRSSFATWQSLLHPDDHDAAMTSLRAQLHDGTPYSWVTLPN